MARKHVQEYFDQQAVQYKEMLDNIKELEESLSENMSNYDILENMKKTIEPIKNNYMTLSWIMYLLNKPANSKKQNKYEKQGMQKLKKINPNLERSPAVLKKENEDALAALKELK